MSNYDASLGRFISRDPIGYMDGSSLYRAYFAPNKLDPMGKDLIGSFPPIDDLFIPLRQIPWLESSPGRPTCDAAERECIDAVRARILANTQNGRCIRLEPDLENTSGSARRLVTRNFGRCMTCRSQLDQCIHDTLSRVRIGCSLRSQGRGTTNLGVARGECVREKARLLDRDCSACSETSLSQSYINLNTHLMLAGIEEFTPEKLL